VAGKHLAGCHVTQRHRPGRHLDQRRL